MQERYQEYFGLLEKLGGSLEKLAALAKEKNAAAQRGDLLAVEELMKQEQALSLNLRGIEKKKEKLTAELGLQGVPLSGLAAHCPEPLRLEARRVQQRLRDRYDIYRAASAAVRNTLECNLHEIEKLLAQEPAAKPQVPGAPATVADFRA